MTHLAERMKTLSSAEDFMQFFGVPYNQKVVDVCRLHILKRFFQYIRQEASLPRDNEVALFTAYRDLLVRAYADFVESTPAEEKVFKVFQDVDGRQHVSVDNLRASLPARGAA